MSDQNITSSIAPPMSLTPQDILTYLGENPDFFKRHPDILGMLNLPKAQAQKGVADFQAYMIDKLKSDKNDIEDATREIITNARNNMSNQQRIHDAVLRLLETNSFGDFTQCLTIDLAAMLGVDIAVLLIESQDTHIPHLQTSGVRMIPSGTIDQWMQDRPILLQDNMSGIEAIYGGGAALVQSQILLRLSIAYDTPPAILAFGSRDPAMFSANQATDQILFLARVIERLFRTWLNLPANPTSNAPTR